MYVVTTQPNFKKITEGNTRKFTVSFAFFAHVDIVDYLSFRHQCA